MGGENLASDHVNQEYTDSISAETATVECQQFPDRTARLAPKHFSFITNRRRRCKASWMFFLVFFLALIPFSAESIFFASMNNNIGRCQSTMKGGTLGIIYANLFYTPLGIGSLSFAQAKAIDVAFDLIVGRVGQLLLLWIAGSIYAAVLNQIMESTKWKALFMLYSVLYLLAFPTMIAATTSYMTMRTATLKLHNGTNINFNYDQWTTATLQPDRLYLYEGQRYNEAYIVANCHEFNNGNVYTYTSAPLFAYFVYLLQFIWSFGMYGLWVDAFRKSRLNQAGRRLGTYRGIVDVAEALNDDLGPNACAYSNIELIKVIEKQPATHGLSYGEIPANGQLPRHLTLSPNKTTGRSSLSLNSTEPYGYLGDETV
ncbi:hypothetical protein K440DRAFT_643944 [Wilcoxina mikolae CBS 423.85]|nr:hypothetical protein K440DRAFT_643944 [Wilcoxina mikolae CBS 423.85]